MTGKEESSQLYKLATSILEECKDTASLDTAIYLFHKALYQHPTAHPLQPDSLKNLLGALFTKFTLTPQCQDLDQAIEMHVEVCSALNDTLIGIEGPFQLGVCIWSIF